MKTLLTSLFPAFIGLLLFVVFVAGPLWMSRKKREELCELEDDYDPEEEHRADYSGRVDDEIMRRVDP